MGGAELFCPAARTTLSEHPRRPLRPVCSARCPAGEAPCCCQQPAIPAVDPTNSSAWPRSKDLPPRPIPPHSDPLALPIYTSEPSTLRRAHAFKRSHKHHEKPQTVSYPSLPQLSLRYFSRNLEPGNPSVFRRSSGIWPAMGVSDSFGAGEAGDRTSELRQARSSQAKQRRASAITVGLRGCSQHRRQPAWRYKPSRERGTCEG